MHVEGKQCRQCGAGGEDDSGGFRPLDPEGGK